MNSDSNFGVNDTTQLKAAAAQFVEATDPRVLMRMPGCHVLAVNDRHHRAYPNAMLPVVTKPQQYIAALKSGKRADAMSAKNIQCYCTVPTIDNMVALRTDDCSFDSLNDDFSADRLSAEVGSGFVFFGMYSEGDTRKYRVSQFFGTRFPSERTPKDEVAAKRSFLDASLVFLPGLRLVVETRFDEKNDLPERLIAWLELHGRQKGKRIEALIEDGEEYEDYVKVYQLFTNAIADLKSDNALEAVMNKLERAGESEAGKAYEQIQDIVKALQIKVGSDRHKLCQALESTRAGLMDAPFVRRDAAIELESLLESQGIAVSASQEAISRVPEQETRREIDLRDAIEILKMEERHYNEQLPELKKKHIGRYIAMVEGRVRGVADDESTLRKQIAPILEQRKRPALIRKVGHEVKPVVFPLGMRIA